MNVDDALRDYVSQSPPLGMEARVMRRVQVDSIRRRWIWLLPGLVAAGVAVAVAIAPVNHQVAKGRAREAVFSVERPTRLSPSVPQQRPTRRPSGVQVFWRVAQDHPEVTAAYVPAPMVPLTIEPISIQELGNQ